jgi:hypothetical protein
MKRVSLLAALGLIQLVVACDKSAPQAVDSTPAAENSAPATEPASSLSGDKMDLKLAVVPLTLHVPVEWKLNEAGGVMAIEGPLPHGDAEIIISRLKPLNAERTQMWFAAATQPADDKQYLTNDVRDINGLKVWETATVEHGAASDVQGGATTVPSWVSWRFTILVPQDQGTLPCSLGFAGMSRADYEAQKDFVESIMGTIQRSDDVGMQ